MSYDWINDWVGVPYLRNGRDANGIDCYGIVIVAYRDQLGKALPDWQTEDSHKAAARVFAKAMVKEVETDRAVRVTDDPIDWDILLVKRSRGMPHHMGIKLAHGVLHSDEASGVRFDTYGQFLTEQGADNVEVWRWLI